MRGELTMKGPLPHRILALGRMKVGGMNKTEAAYAQHLYLRKCAGEVLDYRFEPMNLRLADNTFYRPDFGVLLADGHYELHEVKGHWTDDARVKIKVAAEIHPFRFRAVKKAGTGWAEEVFS